MCVRYDCHEKPGYIACLIAIEISTSHIFGCFLPVQPIPKVFYISLFTLSNNL
ncbi:hypothetical protein HanRHA438_Chr07g0308071 [Helianthus annuus]|uniref:Uncharacterized protein n=1 Tax=Helianthus annuus TaxID=4232 RepID=A0A9K3ILP3_HELAN|nr:hypothetical protein HanXRQr2_Chr07g0297811 [Helianthus annuus]KAJ0904953.1 hypothetical protein HanPSC8_Chr07g0288311 [Helianthus annuus]KAJ0908233.1 hypothetical protein HanRHA438_Chr07g0308071 [Helianthus annuus]